MLSEILTGILACRIKVQVRLRCAAAQLQLISVTPDPYPSLLSMAASLMGPCWGYHQRSCHAQQTGGRVGGGADELKGKVSHLQATL